MSNEQIVRQAYHYAEGGVRDVEGWVNAFTPDGVFNNIGMGESYRGAQLGDIVVRMAKWFPDVHRELRRVHTFGEVVAIELAIQGTFRGGLETPAGVIQPTGGRIDVPTADFFYLRDGKIETFNCYMEVNILFAQLGVKPDFSSAVAMAR